jgi:hypothetical protein
MPKARDADSCQTFEQLPNVGPAMAADLRSPGMAHPQELVARDPLALYQGLCRHTGQRQDPCVLDTLMAVTDFMRGSVAKPWWHYTALRKARYGKL